MLIACLMFAAIYTVFVPVFYGRKHLFIGLVILAVAVVSSLILAGWVTYRAHRLARRRQVMYRPGQQPALRRVK